MTHVLKLLSLLLLLLIGSLSPADAAGGDPGPIEITAPDETMAASLFSRSDVVTVARAEGGVPGWTVSAGGKTVGWIASTWEVANTVGYSGRPIDALVAVTPDGRIAGAALTRHNEPVLTLGISDKDIQDYVGSFRGFDLATIQKGNAGAQLPRIISRATVSTGVIRDGILRTARTIALGQGLVSSGGIDRVTFKLASWEELLKGGAIAHGRMTMVEASKAFAGASVPVQAGSGAFLDLYAGLIDPPAVGRNLLGQQVFTAAIGSLGTNESALFVATAGLHSHRGTDWKQTGEFGRIVIVQGGTRHVPKAADYIFVKKLAISGAPEFKEVSVFRLPSSIEPVKPFSIEVLAVRPAADGTPVSASVKADYALPSAFIVAPQADLVPLWRENWEEKTVEIAIVAAMLSVLTLILFAQEWVTRRPVLWRATRIGYLLVTFLVLGILLNGQLSVVQVIAFVHSLLNGFRWETFLIEPVIFMLWGFVALGLLFWGRGVFCGWLCPFGALQELANEVAQRLGVRQIAVPQAIHERLWAIKYTLFVGIVALSFYSMHDALIAAEAEPFKTAISLRMVRPWPFVAFVLVLLAAGLFIERFYCRYLCVLGAGLAIPAKLKIFDWLKRRPQCGRECRLCETKCTVGAIDSLGRINANECVLCLRCQVIMNDTHQCPVLKRRTRGQEGQPA